MYLRCMYYAEAKHAIQMHLSMLGFLTQATMRLTRYTDYAIRVMIYLGYREGHLCSIREIADAFSISQNHLMKVVQDLAAAGFIDTIRGRGGGIRMATPAVEINLGQLLRHTEDIADLLPCSDCIVGRGCGMPKILSEATAAFVAVFDRYTVADLLRQKEILRALLSAA